MAISWNPSQKGEREREVVKEVEVNVRLAGLSGSTVILYIHSALPIGMCNALSIFLIISCVAAQFFAFG